MFIRRLSRTCYVFSVAPDSPGNASSSLHDGFRDTVNIDVDTVLDEMQAEVSHAGSLAPLAIRYTARSRAVVLHCDLELCYESVYSCSQE